jgi:hypothetical protein
MPTVPSITPAVLTDGLAAGNQNGPIFQGGDPFGAGLPLLPAGIGANSLLDRGRSPQSSEGSSLKGNSATAAASEMLAQPPSVGASTESTAEMPPSEGPTAVLQGVASDAAPEMPSALMMAACMDHMSLEEMLANLDADTLTRLLPNLAAMGVQPASDRGRVSRAGRPQVVDLQPLDPFSIDVMALMVAGDPADVDMPMPPSPGLMESDEIAPQLAPAEAEPGEVGAGLPPAAFAGAAEAVRAPGPGGAWQGTGGEDANASSLATGPSALDALLSGGGPRVTVPLLLLLSAPLMVSWAVCGRFYPTPPLPYPRHPLSVGAAITSSGRRA